MASVNDPVRFFARPLVEALASDIEPVSVLENPLCSARLDEMLSDPVRVLRNEKCASGLDKKVKDPVSARKNEKCSIRAKESPSELERFLVNPLTSEPAIDSDPFRVRDSER